MIRALLVVAAVFVAVTIATRGEAPEPDLSVQTRTTLAERALRSDLKTIGRDAVGRVTDVSCRPGAREAFRCAVTYERGADACVIDISGAGVAGDSGCRVPRGRTRTERAA